MVAVDKVVVSDSFVVSSVLCWASEVSVCDFGLIVSGGRWCETSVGVTVGVRFPVCSWCLVTTLCPVLD